MMRNSVVTGVGIGAVAPLIAFFLTHHTALIAQYFPNKPIVFYVLAAGINMIFVRVFFRKEQPQDQVAKGIILTTFIGLLLLLYFFKMNL